MAEDKVIVPIDLMVTDIKTGDVDLKDVEKSIKTRLSGITKSASDVLGSIDTSKLNKSLISSMDKVTSSYQKLSMAQSKVTDAIRTAGSSSPKFKKELKSIQAEIEKTERAWEDFGDLLLESPVLQSGLNKRDMGLPLTNDEAAKVKFFEEQMSIYEKEMTALQSRIPDPATFISSATTTELQKLINSYYSLFNAVNKVEAATDEWNKTKDANMMTDEYTNKLKELTSLEAKLESIKEKAQKMSAVGASSQSWTSLYYDADLLEKKITQIITELQTMIQTGSAFRFSTGDSVGELDALSNRLVKLAESMGQIKGEPENIKTSVSGLLRVVHNFCTSAQKGLARVIKLFKNLGKTSKHTGKSTHKSLRQIYRDILMLGFGVGSTLFLMRRLRNIFIDTFKEMALQIPEVNDQVSFFVRTLNQLKGSVGTAFQPIVTMVIPALNQLSAALVNAMNALGRFFATLNGQGYIYKFTAAQVDYAESLKDTAGAAKKAQKSLMGFDEINRLNDEDSGGAGESPIGTWEKEMLNGMSTLAELIKQAWSTGDFYEVGQYIGEKLLDALTIADAWITGKGYAFAEKIGKSLATLINGVIDTEGLATKIGKTIADALNMALFGLNTFLKTTDWINLGQFIADWANSSVTYFKWSLLGQTIGNLITAGVNTWWQFVGEFDFSKLGSKIAFAINSMFRTILSPDALGLNTAEKLGQAITKTVRGILETLTTAINETDWAAVGQTIGEVLGNIDWGAIAWDVVKLVGAIVKAIAEAFISWTETDPISAGIATMLGLALGAVNIGASITGILLKFAPLLEATGSLSKIFELVSTKIGTIVSVVGGVMSIITGVVMAISNFFAMLGNGFSWVNEILMILGIALTAIGVILVTGISGAAAGVVGAIAAVIAIIATVVVLVKQYGTEILAFLNDVGIGIVETIQMVIDTVIIIITGIITLATTLIGGAVALVGTILSALVGIVTSVLLAVAGVVATVLQAIIGTISGILASIRVIVVTLLQAGYTFIVTILQLIVALITGNFGAIRNIIASGISNFVSVISNGWAAIKNVWSNTLNSISSSTRAIWNGISNTIKGVINGIIGFVNGMIRGIVSGINAVIGVLNRFKVKIPSWVPQFGGQSFGFNLANISAPQIPRLAEGGVIPPNKEFMAILGDQKHGTNIEAPLDTIKQAVGEELLEYVDAMMAGFEAVVQAINEKDMDVVIGDTAIGRAADRYNKRQSLVRGTL